jgi:hypothetical protein
MKIEGAEVEDDWRMKDWMSRTGTSDVRDLWNVTEVPQRLFLWTTDGETLLGEEDTTRQDQNQVWASLRNNFSDLGDIRN